MKIITRDEARFLGLLHYFTGQPCLAGHLEKRNVNDRACLECGRIRRAKRIARQSGVEFVLKPHAHKNTQRQKAQEAGALKYISERPCPKCGGVELYTCSSSCVACLPSRAKAYYQNNLEKATNTRLARRAKESEEKKEYFRRLAREWKQRNKERHNHLRALYYASRDQRTPKWADKKKIAAVYAACPPGFHVDHIIPLRGSLVSGLHVHTNLQILPGIENMKKSNKWSAS